MLKLNWSIVTNVILNSKTNNQKCWRHFFRVPQSNQCGQSEIIFLHWSIRSYLELWLAYKSAADWSALLFSMTTVTWGVPSNPSIITTKLLLQVSHKINVHLLIYGPQFSWSEQIHSTQKMEPLVYWIEHTFNKENQKNIVEQNENILKHSSLSTCIDLDNMKNANLASLRF